MKITVVLCTFNRCGVLAKALESVAVQTLPESVEWEVLIVDNNSTDQTHNVVLSVCQRFPGRFRYFYEPTPGKSHALNAGIRNADSDILAFMDDDVTVESTWLQNLTAALRKGECSGVGGRTLLAGNFSPPRWLALQGPYALGGVLAAMFDLGDEPCELEPNSAPYGANMAFQRKMFEKYGLFRTDLGPKPGCAIKKEDTEFGQRLMSAGERIRYEPSAVVYHPAPTVRAQKKYFLDWWFDYGRAEIREIGRKPDIWGVRRYYISIPKMVGIELVSRTVMWALALNPQRRFFLKTRIWRMAGQILETHHQRHAEKVQEETLQEKKQI
jgi:glycosyltransferase involved in cell wall biosynthesis